MLKAISELPPDAQALLKENLVKGEDVKLIIFGKFDTALIATASRCFIYKKGMLAGAPFGVQFASFDYEQLSGVDIKTGILAGQVFLQGSALEPGGRAADVPYGLAIGKQNYEAARAGVAVLRALIVAAKAPAAGQPDVMDQLRKLGELRSIGVLSDAEFEAKKAELLSRI